MPSSLLPDTVRGTAYLTEADDGDPAARAGETVGEVYRTKRILGHLAVIPLGKCHHRLLIE